MSLNETLHDAVKKGHFDEFCPHSEHFLKESLILLRVIIKNEGLIQHVLVINCLNKGLKLGHNIRDSLHIYPFLDKSVYQ